jgi:hypothetical protein
MDWILDNLQLILAIAGAIAYWLNARKKEQAGEPADYDGDGEPDTLPQSGRSLHEQDETQLHDENTRRIQEEIRRKIAERQGGGGLRPEGAEVPLPPALPASRGGAPAQAPVARQQPVPPPAVRRREVESPYAMDETRRATVEREAAAVLESQRVLAEQLAALNQRRAETGRTARAMREGVELATAAATASGRARMPEDASLLSDLRNARSLRKAIVMREVLGTPVALR